MDLCTRKTVEGELSEQETRLREEFRQIQAVTDADEREAIIQRMDIADNVLTLRCPRVGCHRAFVDFEGCFALSCSGCRAGFCGWCLADCGADAHAHIAGCGGTYGTLDQFNEVHRVRRAKVVRERLQQMRPEVRRHVQRMLKVDLRDLGIPPEP
ncbi:hypothetical protein B484DRAFT_443812 [Ochromonadaceae sp. CCMP2298]|nr:hypothetical protein B484DRAFT_443812 [Ochromonadaceae sp. CCMP2298]